MRCTHTAADEKGAPADASRLCDSRYALAGSTLSDYAWRRMVDVAQRRAVMKCEHRASRGSRVHDVRPRWSKSAPGLRSRGKWSWAAETT